MIGPNRPHHLFIPKTRVLSPALSSLDVVISTNSNQGIHHGIVM